MYSKRQQHSLALAKSLFIYFTFQYKKDYATHYINASTSFSQVKGEYLDIKTSMLPLFLNVSEKVSEMPIIN